MFIIIYKPADALAMDTKFFGPFRKHAHAYTYLCELPPPGTGGVKYIQELVRVP